MFCYRIMWVTDGITLSCLLSAVIAILSFIFCSLVLWPGEFYVSEVFLLLPLGLLNSLLELTTRTFLTCELSFKSSAHLPVISLKLCTRWIHLSLSFWCLFLLRDMLAMVTKLPSYALQIYHSFWIHIHSLSCSATTGSLGKPYHQLSVVHSVLPHPTFCKVQGTCAADRDIWIFELCDAEDQEIGPYLVNAAFPMVWPNSVC